jgi:cytochrome c oxidase assembly protein subunit 15
MLAYLIIAFALWHAYDARRSTRDRTARAYATLVVLLTIIQAMVGIMTLLFMVPIALALLHQAMAILLLTVVVLHAAGLARRRSAASELARA